MYKKCIKMEENNPKTNQTNFPHLGKLIDLTLYQKRIKKKDVAQYLGLNIESIAPIIKKQSIKADALWKISQFTQHNFFAHLAEKINIPFETATELNLKTQITALQQQLYDLQKENQLLREIVKR